MLEVVNGESTVAGLQMTLDGTNVMYHRDRVEAWERGERIAPIFMDIAWTRRCNAACDFCAAKTQASASPSLDIPREIAFQFLRTKFSPSITVPYELAFERNFAYGRNSLRPSTVGEAVQRINALGYRTDEDEDA